MVEDRKREELRIRFRSMFWLFKAKSHLSLYNKRLLYVMALRPLWSYGLPVLEYGLNQI